MSDTVIAFLVAIAGGTWVYSKFLRRTGNNTKNSLVAAAAVAIVLFIFLLIVLGFITSALKK
jgi:hypothetical protein